MRGKEVSHSPRTLVLGITPAYAGKRVNALIWSRSIWDHPRLCGEKVILNRFTAFTIGSPPPMRGKVLRENGSVYEIRITPAYAGKRVRVPHTHILYRDHPRLCGEKFHNAYNSPLRLGSPPPMRGKAAHYTGGSIECRITPAYAGKSKQAFFDLLNVGDHPRLCGEKFASVASARAGTGITPAYAGKSVL